MVNSVSESTKIPLRKEKEILWFKLLNMDKTRFTESQIISILKQQKAGLSDRDLARELGINEATFYNWKAKYDGMEAQGIKHTKDP